jgi:hypothetical protein
VEVVGADAQVEFPRQSAFGDLQRARDCRHMPVSVVKAELVDAELVAVRGDFRIQARIGHAGYRQREARAFD